MVMLGESGEVRRKNSLVDEPSPYLNGEERQGLVGDALVRAIVFVGKDGLPVLRQSCCVDRKAWTEKRGNENDVKQTLISEFICSDLWLSVAHRGSAR